MLFCYCSVSEGIWDWCNAEFLPCVNVVLTIKVMYVDERSWSIVRYNAGLYEQELWVCLLEIPSHRAVL